MIPGTLSVFQGLKVFQGCLKLATGPLVISYHRMLFRRFFVHKMLVAASSRPTTPPRLRTLTSGWPRHVFFPVSVISVIYFNGYDDDEMVMTRMTGVIIFWLIEAEAVSTREFWFQVGQRHASQRSG